ncbi:PQQ-binding-like beta-propeller repeat protein [Diaminobutyricibacter tongyongensis]|uniref:PQQ-binding-like beta-propeller repeat protein n=1 Tax=Leifsonia tongyongensis TaxID=1268043 RepID=A0A6L9XZU7_9MICO|nr:PQQ-binding-like beta-propeller repeat protein [Diaminobutyricibacter tongyongensis]NEN06911.1 PQQ-binding-like beta-propeller repeat protein [Diaminobutyricibacter tongyongensis]
MSTTEFSPNRSAAVRQLLIETIEHEPQRQRRLQIMLTSILAGIALVLAGGTAALALTGVIHFGDSSPAPVQTTTPTVAPTETPTPTPTQTASVPRVQVQSAVVYPHDVSSLPAQTRWSLDLPGIEDGCRMRPLAYDLADGLTVFLTGTRPKEYEGGTCAEHRDEKIGLTLVDTARGEKIWSRVWAFTSSMGSPNLPEFLVLGTSGRALLDYGTDQSAPHDLIDLTTGETISMFSPGAYSGAVTVPGTSGDIVMPSEPSGSVGAAITAIDPLDPDHPVWKTAVDTDYLQIADGTQHASALPVYFASPAGRPYQRGSVDLENGALTKSPGSSELHATMSFITLWDQQAADGSVSYVAVDGSGARVWSRPATPGAFAVGVGMPGAQPGIFGGRASTSQLAIVDRTSITVLDQLTGQVAWTASTSGCGAKDFMGIPSVMVDPARNALSVRYQQDTACSFDAKTGKALAGVGVPFNDWDLFGLTNTYVGALASDTGTAYDSATGRVLWSLPRAQGEQWLFAGGYLVRTVGDHVESIG